MPETTEDIDEPPPEEVKDALADQLGIQTEEVGEMLGRLARVQLYDEGNIPEVTARPNDADQLPNRPVTRAHYQARTNAQFIVWEITERWVFRLVWWSALIAFIYSLL